MVRSSYCFAVMALVFGAAQSPAAEMPVAGKASDTPVYNITLLTDSTPDLTDIDSYLRSITSQYDTPQDKAIAIFHWSQRLRKQHSLPYEEGHEVLDPVLFFNNYGYTMCAIISGIDNSLWTNMGWKAHYVQLGDHTVNECSWDGGKNWHMFDNSTTIYCFNDNRSVASVREIEKTPRFYLEQFAPECGTNPVKDLKDHQGWRWGADHPVENQRTLANGVDSFLPPNEVLEDHLATCYGRRYVLNLRPGEQYTRYYRNLDAPKADPRYYRPLNGKDVEGAHDKSIRANGVWHYAPNLKDSATRQQIYSESGVTWTADGVKGSGSVVFKVSAANIITSSRIALTATGAKLSVSRYAGAAWEALSTDPSAPIELLDAVAGGTEFLLKVDLEGANASLSALSIDTVTQCSRAALPRLTRGPNQIQFRLGDQVETIVLAPSVKGGNHKKTVCDEKNVAVNAKPYFNVATLCPSGSEPAHVTWKIAAPTPIVSVLYGGNLTAKDKGVIALSHSWDGTTFEEDEKRAGMILPYDSVVLKALKNVPAGKTDAYLRYQFETKNDATKQWWCSGVQTAQMTVYHQPRVPGFTPVEVTWCWVEHRDSGDVERRHTQLVDSPAVQYTLNVGGFRDPTMKWVRVNLKGHGPADGETAYGYSDGDEKPAFTKGRRALFEWGKNVALGKSYKLEGKTSDKNPDAGKDLTDGVLMPPDTYVSVKWMPTNVIFQADVSPVATIDLGAAQRIAAVRVCTGQADDFHLTYPESIVVETSTDGQAFAPVGKAAFNQVFEPPADYIFGECEESTVFDKLPAGGRLAYAYRVVFDQPVDARYVRVTCVARKGWGMLLSELQVFDNVTVKTNIPAAVVLQPLPVSK